MFFQDPTSGAPLEGEELVQAKFQHMSVLMTNYLKARQAMSHAMYYKGQLITKISDADVAKVQALVIDDLAAQIADFASKELLTMDNQPEGGK